MNEMIWILCGTACVVLVGWMLYMMTFRTDDWLRLVKDEQERKAKRDERIDKVVKTSVGIARFFMKK
jgi:hypothetical protein